MKAVVILFFVFAYFQIEVLARAVESVTPLEPAEEQCVTELQLNKHEIEILNSRDIAPEDNSDFNMFMSCYYQKMGWQDGNGKIDYDSFRTSLEGAIAGELEDESPAVRMLVKQVMLSTVTECEENPPPNGNTHGQTVVRVQNCVMGKINNILADA